ncbi:hypothetical protein [Pseudoalteromonas piscicida]|uniref:hypothetical protein n=1 Tax=Pseudoalteromonas piscicida TaxID=43662 RepID=UPI0032C1E597
MIEKLIILIIGSCLGFSFAILKDWINERGRLKSEQYYLAIIVTAYLENFLSKCTEVVWDNGKVDAEGCRRVTAEQPELSLIDLDVNWKSLDKKLLYDLLMIPEKVHDAKLKVSEAIEYAYNPPDFDEIFDERKLQYSKVGLLVCSLIERLRNTCNLPEKEASKWSFEQVFNEVKTEVETSIKNRKRIQCDTDKKLIRSIEKDK